MITSWPDKVFTCRRSQKSNKASKHKIIHMSPQLTSQGMVLATTAAMAVSGTVILLALCLHNKTLPPDPQFHSSPQVLRSCISSSDERRRSRGDNSSSNKSNQKKKKKRVRFADDVVADRDIVINNNNNNKGPCSCPNSSSTPTTNNNEDKVKGMPANRIALYNGILRDRVTQRMAYSY